MKQDKESKEQLLVTQLATRGGAYLCQYIYKVRLATYINLNVDLSFSTPPCVLRSVLECWFFCQTVEIHLLLLLQLRPPAASSWIVQSARSGPAQIGKHGHTHTLHCLPLFFVARPQTGDLRNARFVRIHTSSTISSGAEKPLRASCSPSQQEQE